MHYGSTYNFANNIELIKHSSPSFRGGKYEY